MRDVKRDVRAGQVAKRLLDLLPSQIGLTLLIALRWLSKPSARANERRVRRIVRELGSPAHVLSGPFAGMRYLGPALASQGGYLPKLLGSYEQECAAAIERLIARQPDLLINVGAAEGYYAVGFMTRLPDLRVEAFESERPYHAAIRALARSNGVLDRLSVRGTCTSRRLEAALSSATRPIVVMDCEGGELELLNPRDVSRLKAAWIFVEVHERLRPGVTNAIVGHFAATHRIVRIGTRPNRLSGESFVGKLSQEDQSFALDEGRGGEMEWLLMEPQ